MSSPRTLACLAAGAALLCGSTDALGSVQESGLPVEVVRPEKKDIDRELPLIGTLLAWESATLVPRVTGYVQSISVMPGDTLKQGQEIARIAVPELVAKGAAAEADVRRAEANVGDAEAALEKARAAIAVAEAMVSLRQSELEVCRSDVRMHEIVANRKRNLRKGGAATEEELEEAENQLAMAQARGEAAHAAVESSRSHVAAARAGFAAAEAAIASAAASVEAANADATHARELLAFRVLTNPYAEGVVYQRFLDAGALTRANETAVVSVMNVSKVRLIVSIPERAAPLVSAGTPVHVTLEAFPDRPIQAEVSRVAGALDEMSRTMKAEIDIDNADRRLLPGMFAEVTLKLSVRTGALLVPGSAIRTAGKETFVFVAIGGVARRTPIRIGLDDGIEVEITEGLTGDEQVILGNLAGLRDGDAVSPVAREGSQR